MEPETESQHELNLLRYWHVLRRNWGVVGAFTLMLSIGVTIVSLLFTRYYGAIATIEIRPEVASYLDVNEVSELVDVSNADERRTYYATQYLILQSRTVLERSIAILRDEHGITNFDEAERPVEALRDCMTLEPQLNTNLVQIRVEVPDADKAVLIANTIAQVYMEWNLERGQASTREALDWLQEQATDYRELKRESDLQLHDFKFENDLTGLDSKRQAIYGRLESLERAWNEVRIEQIQAEAEVTRLSDLAESGAWLSMATLLGADDSVLQDRLRSLRELEQERTRLEARYREGWPALIQLNQEIDGLEDQVHEQVRQIIEGRQVALETIRDREAALSSELAAAKTEAEIVERRLIEYNLLAASAEKNESFYRNLEQRRTEVDLANLIKSNNVQWVDRAIPNYDPVRPKVVRSLALAIFVGLLGGSAIAFFMEYIDRTIKGPEDIERLLNVPALGPVPKLPPEDREGLSELDRNIYVYARPKSQVAERLRDIRTNVLFRTPDHRQRRLLITSAMPMEGKSFVSSNLAAILAMTGHRILLIDADLRRPTQHKLFQLHNEVGLSSVLIGDATIEQAVQRTHVPNLDILTGGPQLPTSLVSPAELFDSDRMTSVLNRLTNYDIIVLDSSPVGAVSDPLILSRMVDGVLMVVYAGQTPRDMVLSTHARLKEMNANMLGVIVNRFDHTRSGYGYYYAYGAYGYYGEDRDEEPKEGQLPTVRGRGLNRSKPLSTPGAGPGDSTEPGGPGDAQT